MWKIVIMFKSCNDMMIEIIVSKYFLCLILLLTYNTCYPNSYTMKKPGNNVKEHAWYITHLPPVYLVAQEMDYMLLIGV